MLLLLRDMAPKLLHIDGPSDRKPSMLVNEMLVQMFREQMPDDIHLLRVDEDFTDPRRVATNAGVLWQAIPSIACRRCLVGSSGRSQPPAKTRQCGRPRATLELVVFIKTPQCTQNMDLDSSVVSQCKEGTTSIQSLVLCLLAFLTSDDQ